MLTPVQPGAEPARSHYPVSRGHSWFVFAILFLLMTFDYVDRNIVVSMLPFIKTAWGLSDAQLGSIVSIVPWMVGIVSVPAAVLADRWSRVNAILLMGVIWSLATISCMLASTYAILLTSRAIIGIGEAGYGNAGSALLAHHFSPDRRSTVVGGFYFANSLGSLLGIVLGGIISARWGWQAGFGMVGVPGLIIALFVLFIRDYPTVPLVKENTNTLAVLKNSARQLIRPRTAIPTYLGSGLLLFVAVALYSWMPTYFVRYYGVDGAAAGIKAAPIVLAGAFGGLFWAYVADRLAARAPGRKLLVAAGCAVGTSLVLFPTFMWMAPGPNQYWLIVFGSFLMTAVAGITTAVAMDIVHPGLRSTAVSVVTLANNIIGLGGGPFIVGLLSDAYGLTTALALGSLFALPAAFFLAIASRTYANDRWAAAEVIAPAREEPRLAVASMA
jgi:MFS transporter, Spinster family, sphingosine-1-phosphate transporter